MGSTLFRAFRTEDGYISYEENRTPVTYDVNEGAIIYACVLISVSTLIAVIGIRGKERWNALIRVAFSLFIGSVILVSVMGNEWMNGSIAVNTTYIFSKQLPFTGVLGINVALDHANITLKGTVDGYSSVNYKEMFSWKDLGDVAESFWILATRGAPQPILTVSDYLSIDVGGLRWGRSYFLAGHFARILLWSAFAFWIVTNVMLFSVVYYSAIMLFMTGVCMVLSPVSYHIFQPVTPLSIPYGQDRLQLKYGWCFWLPLVSGAICVVLGLQLLLLDYFLKKKVANFFSLETEVAPEEDCCYDGQFKFGSKTPQLTKDGLNGGYVFENGAYNDPSFMGNSPKDSESDSSGYGQSTSSTAAEPSGEFRISDDSNFSLHHKSADADSDARLKTVYVDVEMSNDVLRDVNVDKRHQKEMIITNPIFHELSGDTVVDTDRIYVEDKSSADACDYSNSWENSVSSSEKGEALRFQTNTTFSDSSTTDVTEVESCKL